MTRRAAADRLVSNMLRTLADFMEREAGHVVISLLVLLAFTVLWKFGFPGAELMTGAAAGWLGRSMGSASKP
jgi:hypothetical protein